MFLFAGVNTYAGDNATLRVSRIPQIQKQALKKYKHIKVQSNYSKQMQSASKKVYQEFTNNKTMQGMIETYEKNIYSSRQFQSAFKKYVPYNYYAFFNSQVKRAKNLSPAVGNDRLFICISQSMPMNEIRSYVRQVAYLGDKDIVFVLRGFIGGVKYIKPTIRFFYNATKKDPNCSGLVNCKLYSVVFDVNPLVFRKYKIDRVPAFVFVPNYHRITHSNFNKDDGAYVLYGDVSLKYAIELLYKNSKYIRLKQMLDQYRQKSFFH